MTTKILKAWALGSVLLALAATPAGAQPMEDVVAKGLELARAVDTRDAGFGDFTARLRMILRNRHGQESVRRMRTRTLEVEGDGDKSLVVFDEPRDVEGTALLSYTHKEGSDDQWLYLPALKRVKRIASDNKAGPFMGSEFAYEDIASQEVEKYAYRFLGDETVEGQPGFVLERIPVDPKSGYSRQIVWYDEAELRPWKVEYYDRKGDLLKTLTFREYGLYADRHWRASRYEMVNHQTGKSTVLEWTDYEFKTGLSERDFDQNALRRAR
jgi:outer membrane lipoprotein-sorting protein